MYSDVAAPWMIWVIPSVAYDYIHGAGFEEG
jgi:hypothetical protein